MNFGFQDFQRVRVFVAGDLMLDRFEYGNVTRISPEAPVPVFRFAREKKMLGGVGNVAANLMSLGCSVTLAGAVGSDAEGETVRELVRNSGATSAVRIDRSYQTVVKTRLIAGNNHLLRADIERDAASVSLMESDWRRFRSAIAKADVVLLSDYAKGFLTADNCSRFIALGRQAKKPVLVDPKGSDWEKYRGATLVKPNLREFSLVCGRTFNASERLGRDEMVSEARIVCHRFGIRNLLITLSEHGMLFVPATTKISPIHVPAETREVFDVSGAGDTALAAFGAVVGSGRPLPLALKVANVASGIVVSKLGTATVSVAELEQEMGKAFGDERNPFARLERKIVSPKQIGAIVARARAKGLRIGFTNGCFDCCHLGHLFSLVETKRRCDVLVVGLNSDSSVRRHKGPSRPVQDERTRAMNLAANSSVDYVVVFDDDVPMELVKSIRPDVIAKEGYPLSKWPEGRLVKRMGGEVVGLKRLPGYSTSALVERMSQK